MSTNPKIPPTEKFEGVSILIPVIDESTSLLKTVEILMRDLSADIVEIIVLICKKTTPQAMAAVEQLKAQYGDLVIVHDQVLPFVGGAYREAFDMARASHSLVIASDMETDPNDAARIIAEGKKHPSAIICTSRWINKGAFSGYSPVKLFANWVFQKIFSTLYGCNLTDMTFGYRLSPTRVLQAIRWEELRHPFFFETIIKPIRLGVPVMEIDTKWAPRSEGESHNTFLRNFDYFRPGFSVRFAPAESMLKEPNGES